MRFKSFILLLIFALAVSLQAGTIGKWRNYTAKKEIRGVIVVDSAIWAATSGGLFSYSFRDSSLQQFTTSEGLHTIDLTALAADQSGTIWIGASNGLIHFYNPRTQSWGYISGIADVPNEPQKNINALQVSGDTLYALSDLGVSVISISTQEFGDTYMRFGTGSGQISGNAVAVAKYQNNLWVATSSGIASTPLTNQNPLEPGSWQVVNAGLPSTSVNALNVFQDTLFAATASGLAWYNGSSWQAVAQTIGISVTALSTIFGQGLASTPASLYFSAGNQLWRYSDNFTGVIVTGFASSLTSLASHGVVGTAGNGVYFDGAPLSDPDGSTWHQIVPPGPPVNQFSGLAVDQNGVLWSGTGSDAGNGFMSFDGTTWNSFTPATLPQLNGASHAYIVNIGADNSKWISMYGEGVVQIDKNNQVLHIFNTTNGLAYTKNDPNNTTFVVGAGVLTDAGGNAWINVRGAIDRNLVAVYSPSSQQFHYYNFPLGYTLPNLTNIIQDQYGTKWFVSITIEGKQQSPGLVFYDPTLTMPRRYNNSTGWGLISQDVDGLTDNAISALAVDLDGSLWVGTNQGGLNIIVDPAVPYQILQYHPLIGQKINDLLVDPLNQKWVATEQGVFILSPDGTSIIDQLTNQSTDGKLPDDRVETITMNRATGTMYFGTVSGLATLTTVSIAPVASFNGLKIFPNPFLLPSTTTLTIDGLVEGSSIKILTPSGNLVKDIVTPGGRVGFWDGTDQSGNLVASGVYIVTAYSKDGSAVGNGKVAVLRK